MLRVPVLVQAEIVGGVQVTPSPLFLGIAEPGTKVTKNLVVRAHRPFRITDVDGADEQLHVTLPDKDLAQPIHVVRVTFRAEDEVGEKRWKIRFQTDLNRTSPEIIATAVVGTGNKTWVP